MKTKLNFGCGTDILKDHVNIDCGKIKGIDIIHDLNIFPYPLPENHFKEVKARFILEHLDNTKDANNVKVLEE